MRASLLFKVRMRGEETIRTSPLVSAAVRRRFRLKLLSIDPSAIPSAPPDPVPTAAGRLTAKFGFETELVKGDRPAVGVLPSVAPPAAVTREGNARPVGLPVASLNVVSPPHWMPT